MPIKLEVARSIRQRFWFVRSAAEQGDKPQPHQLRIPDPC